MENEGLGINGEWRRNPGIVIPLRAHQKKRKVDQHTEKILQKLRIP